MPPIVYFDSSALVKLIVDEVGSDLVDSLWDGCDAAVSSRLAYPEVCAALAAAHGRGVIAHESWPVVWRQWRMFWDVVRPIELGPAIGAHAGDLATSFALRGADAVHLASALALGIDDVIVAVWDRQLHRAAQNLGLAVAPASVATRKP